MINFHVVSDTFFSANPSSEAKSASIVTTDSKNESLVSSKDAKGMMVSETPEDSDLGQEELLRQCYVVLNTLKNKDFTALSNHVHPQKGLTLTPYSTVDPGKDQTLKCEDIAKASNNTTLYVWGVHDGSGAPIQLSIADYFDKFVYNADYRSAPMIGINTVLSTGNSLENVSVAYPNACFVEFYYPKRVPQNNGLDWCGLKLVFEQVCKNYKLVGIIHSEWTI